MLIGSSSSIAEKSMALRALSNRVSRPENRSCIVRAGGVEACSELLVSTADTYSAQLAVLAAGLLGRLIDSWEGRRALERSTGIDRLIACLGTQVAAVEVRTAAAGALARLAGSDDGWESLILTASGRDFGPEDSKRAAAEQALVGESLPVSASEGESGMHPPSRLQLIVDACISGSCPDAIVCLACVGARHEEGASMLLRAGALVVVEHVLDTTSSGSPASKILSHD